MKTVNKVKKWDLSYKVNDRILIESEEIASLEEPTRITRQKAWEEVLGILLLLEKRDRLLVAKISNVLVELPFDLEPTLSKLLGQRIAILRTDIAKKEFLIRVLDERKVSTVIEPIASLENEQISNDEVI